MPHKVDDSPTRTSSDDGDHDRIISQDAGTATHGDIFSHVQADLVRKSETDDLYDFITIGFGPASLAIAVAIYDILEERAMHDSRTWTPKLKFLERQASFGWHAGMLLPGTKMQISFIKDLATMRNPRSHFTFLNYLKEHNRLVQFSNLDTFLPLRIEFEDYLKWSARHFSDVVEYSQNVINVKPLKAGDYEKFNCLEVTSKDTGTGKITTHRGRSIAIAVGGRPSIPPIFSQGLDRVIHSSQYNQKISIVLPNKDKAYNIAVVGSGQSAAEVFNDLQSRYPNSKTCLLMRDSALRPSDDSPFVNEVFNPEIVDTFYASAPDARSSQLRRNKATNYSVVRLNLLEQIYENMYHQRIHEPDPEKWQHRILPSREVVEVVDMPQNKRLNLTVKNLVSQAGKTKEILNVDAVVLATGYIRDVHNEILNDCQVMNGSHDGSWAPDRDYQVKLNRDFVQEDVHIYLQGCNEQTHGLSDTLLSILATRGGEIVESVFGKELVRANQLDMYSADSADGFNNESSDNHADGPGSKMPLIKGKRAVSSLDVRTES